MADICFILLSHCLLLGKNNIFDPSMSSHFNQALFKRRGGDFRDNTCVQQIVPGDVIRVKTNRGIWHADSLVVTVGPWAGGSILKRDLMLSLPLEVRGFYICVTKVRVIAFISSTGRSQSHSYYSVGCSFDKTKFKMIPEWALFYVRHNDVTDVTLQCNIHMIISATTICRRQKFWFKFRNHVADKRQHCRFFFN